MRAPNRAMCCLNVLIRWWMEAGGRWIKQQLKWWIINAVESNWNGAALSCRWPIDRPMAVLRGRFTASISRVQSIHLDSKNDLHVGHFFRGIVSVTLDGRTKARSIHVSMASINVAAHILLLLLLLLFFIDWVVWWGPMNSNYLRLASCSECNEMLGRVTGTRRCVQESVRCHWLQLRSALWMDRSEKHRRSRDYVEEQWLN